MKIAGVLALAFFIGLFELAEHVVFVEEQPMLMGNLIVFGVILIVAFFFTRFILGIIERMQRESFRRN